MRDFFVEGGVGMYPVALLGLVLVVGSARYARDGEPVRLRFALAAALALVVAILQATLADVAAVLRFLEDTPSETMPRYLVMGLKESTRPALLGGGLLMIGALLVVAGVYRVGRRELDAARGA